jgi:hypothetical protein
MISRALGHLISCKQASRLVSQAQDRPLGRWEGMLLRLHLAACAGCTRFAEQVRFLREAMTKYRE